MIALHEEGSAQVDGVAGRYKLEVAGRPVRSVSDIELEHLVGSGTCVKFTYRPGRGPIPQYGDVVTLKHRGTSREDRSWSSMRLWADTPTLEDGPSGRHVRVSAYDPLWHASEVRQYRSWSWEEAPTLAAFWRDLMVENVPWLEPSDLETRGHNVQLLGRWWFQDGVVGGVFGLRIARGHGCVPVWDGARHVFVPIGGAESMGALHKFKRSDLRSWSVTDRRSVPALEMRTIDRVTRKVKGRCGKKAERPMRMTAPSPNELSRASALHLAAARRLGARFSLQTSRGGILVGDRVQLPGGFRGGVEQVRCIIRANGTFLAEVWGTEDSYWGLGNLEPDLGPQAVSLHQARVEDARDPLGYGRVRVVLETDPFRKPTDWIPFVVPAAGEGRGWHWPPEPGDIVIVASETHRPENLMTLGVIRGEGAAIGEKWSDNELRLAARGGTLALHDEGMGMLHALKRLLVDAGNRLDLGGE